MRTTDTRVRRTLTAMAAGRPVVITGGSDRDHQGWLAFAAEAATAALVAFTVRHTSGYLRVALPGSACTRLSLPPIWHGDNDSDAGGHRVAVDWEGTGTGISARDRAATIVALSAEESEAEQFRRPGHVVPVQVATGGVLGRPGPAEAALDLARLAGCRAAAVLCDLVSRNHPTAMCRGGELVEFAAQHRLPVVSITELAAYRRRTEPQVVRAADNRLPHRDGTFHAIRFREVHGDGEHLAVIIGNATSGDSVPLHVHVECLTSDVFGSNGCRCGTELSAALADMRAKNCGLIVYLRPPGPMRGCGLGARAGWDAEDLSHIAAWILRDLGVYTMRLSDESPGFGLVIFGRIRERGLRIAG